MERGLLWLPFLGAFIWLAWSGKNEYDKLEAYRPWAEEFDRAKYDIYAVLGQKDKLITWGKPTKKGIVDQQSFSLEQVQEINLVVDKQTIDLAIDPAKLPSKGKHIYLEFALGDAATINIPFTEIPMAGQWGVFLRSQLSKNQLQN